MSKIMEERESERFEILVKENESLKRELAEAREVIGFYGDKRNWELDENTIDYSVISQDDWELLRPNKYNKNSGGKRARAWLAKYKGEGK